MPRPKKPEVGPIGTAGLRDPRITWLFLIVAFIVLLFACILIVAGDTEQKGFVYALFGMSGTFLSAGGFIKFELATIFGAKKAG